MSTQYFNKIAAPKDLMFYLDFASDFCYPNGKDVSIYSDLIGNETFSSNGDVLYLNQYEGINNFSGVNTRILSDNLDTFPNSFTEFSVFAWFKHDNVSSDYRVAFYKGNGGTVGSSEFWIGISSGNNVVATIGANTGVGWAAGQTDFDGISNDNWINAGCCWDGSICKVYVNGQFNLQYDLTTYSRNAGRPITLGTAGESPSYQFIGNISNATIYNRALTDDEVLTNYNALKYRFD